MSLMRWTVVLILLVLNASWVTCQMCNDGEYAPDPFDCNGFRQCLHGQWVQRFCPRYLHFNRFISACDFSWNANCELEETTTTSTSTPTPTTETTPPTETTTTQTTPTPPPTTTTETTTPPETTTTQTTPTPPPTTTTETTPTPETTTTQTTPTPPPTTTTETTPTPPPTTTTPVPTTTTPIPCTPSCNPLGPQPQHLPHPNCSMFYKCAHGIPHEMICRFAQHWSIATDRCESPDVAECNEGDACEQADARPPDFW
ncbi:integumentary mucin C.1-like isoform X6 [Bradysia coprophila]|uniref:integumentary mucin C.1-like isoform X6 n=1 Tax=Bradysia coprophila TaxID=38358 RepID=UPI00187DC413|nr:integumentary mucin C.1-like isoform X6 [Bradysia coprophila]